MASLVGSEILSQLKLRGSLGYTGSQNFNSYQSIATYTYNTSNAYNGNIGAMLTAMPNNRLKWQRKYDRSVGIDLGLFAGKLQGRFDYYSAVTDDLLTDVTIPSSIAADAVITLKTEPGSYVSAIALFLQTA